MSNQVAAREITTAPRKSDILFRGVLTSMSMSSLVILTLIGGFLAYRGLEAFKSQGLHFITQWDWSAGQDSAQKDSFGLGAMIIGTLVIAAIALVIGVPVSVLSALYLTFYAPEKLKKLFNKNIKLNVIKNIIK